jgi:hypothetical protein
MNAVSVACYPLLHAAADGDSALFLLVILGIVAATVVAIIRGRRSR